MKPKPISHKNENTFKFESFTERLNKINISTINHLKRRFDGDEDEDLSLFAIALEKWRDLNCSQDFKDLCRQIGSPLDVQNLVQILHKKQQLINVLIENLQLDNKALNAILELLVALARDLQSDFYEYFPTILERLVDLMCQVSEVESIEALFVSQTFLFKHMWKFVLKDIRQHYETLKPAFKSKKEFVLNFSAEAFSFVLRKCKQVDEIFEMMFESEQNDPDLSRGVGRILFETVKGVNQELNSKAKMYLSVIFTRLSTVGCLSSIKYFIDFTLNYASPNSFQPIWTYLNIAPNQLSGKHLENVIDLIDRICLYRNCKYTVDSSQLLHNSINYLLEHYLDSVYKAKVLKLIEMLFIHKQNELSEEEISYFCENFYIHCSRLNVSEVLFTSKQILASTLYERRLAKYCNRYCLKVLTEGIKNEQLLCLEFLAYTVIFKKPRPLYGQDIYRIDKYLLEFEQNRDIIRIISQNIQASIDSSNFEEILWSIIVLPNLEMVSEQEVSNLIQEHVFGQCLKWLKDISDPQRRSLVYRLLLEAIVSLIIVKSSSKKIITEITPEIFISIITDGVERRDLMPTLDIYLSYNQSVSAGYSDHLLVSMATLYPLLEANFSSPYRIIRLASLHIMTLFTLELEGEEKTSIFQICHDSELVPLELSQYRERLRQMRKLDCNFVQLYVPKAVGGVSFDSGPVHFLLGTLFENLSLLWNPLLEILQTYAQNVKERRVVSEILLTHFKKINSCILTFTPSTRYNLIEEMFKLKTCSELDDFNFVPDYYNHRLLLLKGFQMFPDIIEVRNRDFVELFFNFLSNELNSYYVLGVTNQENITQVSTETEGDEKTELENVSGSAKSRWKTFHAFLQVFAKFKNPKALYRESQLLELYKNLLLVSNSSIQKHSMNCLFTYNYSYLNKYKENFLRLLDDKSFSSEIHAFMIHDNSEENIVVLEDRENVIPLFLRILYGKMLASSGGKVHGKSRIDFLRSIVFKTLACFTEKEQIEFMQIVFASLKPFLETDYDQLKDTILSSIKLDSFIPFKRFQSYITTLESIMKNFGSKSTKVMQYMFKVLVVCSSICSHLLSKEHRAELKDYVVNSLKTFRTNCFKVAEYFYVRFDNYHYSSLEIDGFFVSLINPLIVSLDIDSLSSPSPLLKLFSVWSKNSRFYPLFVKQIDSYQDLTPIQSIVKLYSHPKVSSDTVNYLTTLFENLLIDTTPSDLFLALKNDDLESDLKLNDFGIPLPKSSDYPEFSEQTINFGSLILIPFIRNILERIQRNYSTKTSASSKLLFTLQEINVLARLSFFVKNSSDSRSISILLLHSISQVRRPEEDKEVFTLKTLNHLANNLCDEDFSELLNITVPLFNLVDKPLSRKSLCQFFCTLSNKNAHFESFALLIKDINSYDSRMPEEPDYDKRISAFKQILALLSNFTQLTFFECHAIQLLLHNCSFFLNTYDDMSLKELSSNVIFKIGTLFQTCSEEMFNRFIINLLLYKIISTGLRQQKESVRNEYVNILVHLIKLFPGKHSVIDDLLSLCSEEEEVDFWLNIKHIQLHRRARALTRLIQREDLKSLSSRVYLNFLIPIVSSFITSTHAKNVAFLNASIDSLAVFLQQCPWSKYESTLFRYVNGLMNGKIESKLAIRVISAMLEKFSFLKPEHVAMIEKQLDENVFKHITLEYNFSSKKKDKLKKPSKKRTRSNLNESKELVEQKASEINDETESADELEKDQQEVSSLTGNLNYYRKIYDSLCKKLLPLLHKCLHQRSQVDYMYDSYKDEFSEDEEIQRIPIALAIVKLLKHIELNQQLFQANLNSIFLRLCQFLQSRADSIRDTSRNTFVQILLTLGPKYFPHVFYEMKSLLTRGYQRHVLVYTVYIMLSNLMPQLEGGDLDSCMVDVIDLCHMELFGNLSDEKEVSHIVTKTKEAKKIKGYDIYEILAQFVSESALVNLIIPLQNVMSETSNHKMMKKVEAAFNKVGRGLVSNRFISQEALMTSLVDIFNRTMPSSESETSYKVESLSEKLPARVDSFIIPEKSLRRVHQVSKLNRDSNLHLLADFALTCYLYLLKNNRLVKIEQTHCKLLEPTLVYLKAYLYSKDTKVVTTTLHCIHTLLIKFGDLDSFKLISQDIVMQIFVLLRKYSGVNTDNTQLLILCFKTIAYFIYTRSECKLSNEQIAVLLSYAEKEIENNSQNSTIYFMLKSIISRKFVSKELHQLMEILFERAITTDVENVRVHATELSIKYLTEVPLESTRLKGKIVKLVRHLEFKTISGRLAAITILKGVIQYLTPELLGPLKNHIFVPTASRLINEESPECKKLIAETISKLWRKLSSEDVDNFFDAFIIPWLGSDLILAQSLGSSLCALLINHEQQDFEKRLSVCLPFIQQQLEPTRFKTSDEENSNRTTLSLLKSEDNLIFHHLTFVLKVLKLDNSHHLLTKAKYYQDFNEIFNFITNNYLLHPHTWIRCLSTQIFGQLFALFSPDSFVDDIDLYKNTYLFQDVNQKMFELGKKFCLVFRDIYNCETVSEQLIKNLIYIARVLITCGDDSSGESDGKASLRWLLNKLLFEVKFEVKTHPDQSLKRSMLFKWIAAVALQLGKHRVVPFLPSLLPPLCRQDISGLENGDATGEQQASLEELVTLNKQVLQLIRNLVGSEAFVDHFNQARNQISHKRLERRKQRAIEMVTNMTSGVKRKQKKHHRSSVAKRRRVATFKNL